MICCLHLTVTYDNYRCTYCAYSLYYSNYCEFEKSQVKKEKDNRPSSNRAVIF